MDFQYVLYEKHNRIAYVTINRPEVMNALHPPARAELDAVWADFMEDADVWVAILTGAGERAFSAGADLKYRATEADEAELRSQGGPGWQMMARCWKPIIAAVNGYAVGGGLELALRCDIIVAAEHAQFGLPEPRRGLLADEGGVVELPRRIPYHMAMGMILTGRFISAQEAFRAGLVSEVALKSGLLAAAERWAEDIKQCSPLAVQAAKQTVIATAGMPVETAVSRMETLETVRRLRQSEDYVEGPKAFAEKRKPVWKGR